MPIAVVVHERQGDIGVGQRLVEGQRVAGMDAGLRKGDPWRQRLREVK